eukprot:TRINITY_DN1358_c1_g1_i1.p1 TRINITY_DN1358_c1_g1~~TRINITY_DN1358_c1_g1_i1.p1  ORF type:complete len:843 (+),score=155.28 TRINITY_DN1358_c1_g1_i1:449-2977(+)
MDDASPFAHSRPAAQNGCHSMAGQPYSKWLGPGDFFDLVKLGLAVIGRDGVISCSDCFAEMVGCPVAEARGRRLEDFSMDDFYRAKEANTNGQTGQKKQNGKLDYRWRKDDGTCVWLRIRASTKCGEQLMCVFDDVTELKELQEKLEVITETKNIYEGVFENLPIGIGYCGPKEKWMINKALEDISGHRREDVGNLDKWFLACYKERAPAIRELYEVLKADDYPREVTLELWRNDGTRRWVEFTGRGYVGGEVWLIQDITERLINEEKSRCVFDYSLEPMLLLKNGIIVDCNVAAVKCLRAKDKSSLLAMGLTPTQVSPEFQPDGQLSSKKFAALWSGLLANGECRGEWTHQRLDGTTFPTFLLARDIRVGERMVVLAVWQDLTEVKKHEEELRLAKEAAERASLAKSRFLANMSHEIRTPMNGVIGVAELLRNTPMSEEQKSYLEIIRTSGDSLLRILSDVLDLAKVESQSLQLESIEFGLRDLLSDTLALLRVASQEKGLKLCTEINAEVPDKLVGDPTRLRQVLLNLLSNAIKFTEKGSIRVKVGVDMQKRKRRRVEDVESGDGQRCSRVSGSCMLNFDVIDNGVGIAPETASQLFEAFTQADSSTSRKYGGTGLGLTICKNLVSLMGGEIAVISDIGVGSTFSFSVRLGLPPLFSRKRSLSPTPPTSSARDSPTRSENTDASSSRIEKWKGLSVLIVEDNKVNQIVATRMLKLLGLQKLDVVENGAKAVDACKKVRYDIVLMDCHMPEMDGFEATLQIRALSSQDCSAPDWSQPLIAALTASALSHERERCEQVGMDVFLTKPVQVKDLEIVLRSEAEGLYQTRRQPQAERVPGEALD